MTYKWIGAVLVIAGCGGFGFSLAWNQIKQEQLLRQFIRALRLIQWELQYKLTELPELARMAGKECSGSIRSVFLDFARELDWQSAPDAAGCMHEAIKKNRDVPAKIRHLLRQLGSTLGRYELEGQLQGLDVLREECRQVMTELEKDRSQRLRTYQTLGLCAGAALVILFA